MSQTKQKLRIEAKLKYPRRTDQRRDRCQRLCELLLNEPTIQNAKKIGIFFPRLSEVDLLGLWKAKPKICSFPKVEPTSQKMAFYLVKNLSELHPDFAGIPAPDPKQATLVDQWGPEDLLLVPALSLDPWGARLGSGKGYYDRFLARYPKLPKWGLCWREQLSEVKLPQDKNDVSMDRVWTDSGPLVARDS